MNDATNHRYQEFDLGVAETIRGLMEGEEEEVFNPNKKKPKTRVRITNACDSCKRGHLKCDGNTFCSNCAENNRRCVYSLNKKRGPKSRIDKFTKHQQPQRPHSSTPDYSEVDVESNHVHSGSPSPCPNYCASPENEGSKQTMDQLVSLNARLIMEINEKDKSIASLTSKYQDLQRKCADKANPNTPLLNALVNNEHSLMNTITKWIKSFSDVYPLRDVVELPGITTVYSVLKGNVPFKRTRIIFVYTVLIVGSSVAMDTEYREELIERAIKNVDDDILDDVDAELIFSLMLIAKIMFCRMKFAKGNFYGTLALEAATRSPHVVNPKLKVKIWGEIVHFAKDINQRNYLFLKALALKPKGIEFASIIIRYVINSVCRPLSPREEEWNSPILFSYINEAEEALKSVENYSDEPAFTQFLKAQRLNLWSLKASLFSREQKAMLALYWADKAIAEVEENANCVYAVTFALNVHLKYRRLEMLKKGLTLLLSYSKCKFDFGEYTVRCIEKALHSNPPYDDKYGCLSFIPEFARFFAEPETIQDRLSFHNNPVNTPVDPILDLGFDLNNEFTGEEANFLFYDS